MILMIFGSHHEEAQSLCGCSVHVPELLNFVHYNQPWRGNDFYPSGTGRGWRPEKCRTAKLASRR